MESICLLDRLVCIIYTEYCHNHNTLPINMFILIFFKRKEKLVWNGVYWLGWWLLQLNRSQTLVFPTSRKNVPKIDPTRGLYYDRKKGKKKRKEMMPLEQPTSLRMEPLIPIKYDARIHSGGKFQRVLITRRSRRVPMDCKLLVVVWLQMPINFFHHISFG